MDNKITNLLIIAVLTFLPLILLYLILGDYWETYWYILCIYLLPPIGKETSIVISEYLEFSTILIIFTVIYYDIVTCLFIMYNWWVVEEGISRVKFLNNKYAKIKIKAVNLKNKHKSVNLALFIIMITPIIGGGAITTSILSSILEVKKSTVAIIVGLGSLIYLFALYYFMIILK